MSDKILVNQLKVLALLPGFPVSSIMDVIHPLLALQSEGSLLFRTEMEYAIPPSAIRWADVIVFCRNTAPQNIWGFQEVLARNIPYVYDLDDNFFEISTDTAIGRYHRAESQMITLEAYLQNARLVRVYSQRVEELVRKHNSQVELVVPPIKWMHIQPAAPRHRDDRLRIVYATSRQEDLLEPIFRSALIEILKKYSGRIQMVFWGMKPDGYTGLDGVEFWPFENNYNRFLHKFSRFGFDIGLAPLFNTPFHLSKTNAKFRDYSACKIAGVYSNVSVYSDCVQNHQTGMLVENNSSAWYDAVSRLIEESELRLRIITKAYNQARAEYTEANFNQTWLRQIQDAHELKNKNDRPAMCPSVSLPFQRPGLVKRLSEKNVEQIQSIVIGRLISFWNLYKINYLKRF